MSKCAVCASDKADVLCATCLKTICDQCASSDRVTMTYYKQGHCIPCAIDIAETDREMKEYVAGPWVNVDVDAILEEATSFTVDEMCYCTSPCKHEVHIALPLHDGLYHVGIMRGPEIAWLYEKFGVPQDLRIKHLAKREVCKPHLGVQQMRPKYVPKTEKNVIVTSSE
jgi:hypothetical protein